MARKKYIVERSIWDVQYKFSIYMSHTRGLQQYISGNRDTQASFSPSFMYTHALTLRFYSSPFGSFTHQSFENSSIRALKLHNILLITVL